MSSKITLSNKKKAWVGKRTTNLKGKPLQPNAGLEASYYKKIMRLLDAMAKETDREVIKLFNGEAAKEFAQDASISSAIRILMSRLNRKYESAFSKSAKRYAEYLVRQNLSNSKRSVGASLKELSGGLTISTDIVSGPLKEVVKAAVIENVDLIKSIKSDYMDKIKGDLLRSINASDSGGLKGLQDRIHNTLTTRYKQQRNKAKNIALDQTRKVYNNINAERMKKVGVKRFVWHHSGGSKNPRRDHQQMDGEIYSFDDLPIIDARTGERGIPGQAINCRCFMSPVIGFNDGEEIN